MKLSPYLCVVAGLLPLAVSAAALPAYRPQPVRPAPDAGYVLPDGSIRIVGTEYVQSIVSQLDALFARTHPGLTFTLQLRGTSTAIPALTHGVTLFAPMGREAGGLELVPYKKIVGAVPLELRVAHASNTSPTLPTSLALYVNKANPIERLTLDQVARIFGSGGAGGDITRWRQLGLAGEWAGRAIHPYGTPETGGFGAHMKHHLLRGASFSPAYEAAPNTRAILQRVALDTAGIGFAAIGNASPQLRVVAVSAGGGAWSDGSAADVVAGTYPFGRYLYFSLRRTPGQAVDPVTREYMRMVLSQEGQAIISAGTDGFLPLNAQEAAEELARLDEAAPAAGAIPDQAAQPAGVAQGAPYLMRDGSIRIVGNDGMKPILERFNALFARTHPGARFTMLLEGSSTGIGGLTAGVSAFAPMGREAWPSELAGFRDFFGYLPLDVHIGYGGFSHAGHKNPPAIYVNKANPLAGLTLEQITRIMTSGAAQGDITHWRQLGLNGRWAQHAIHLYGPPDDGGLATSIRTAYMDKLPFASRYEALPKAADILDAVAGDVYGIALAGFSDAARLNPNVRLLPLARTAGAPFADAGYDQVAAGRYPYVPYLRIYVNRTPGKPLDPLVRDYLRMVLSPEGQAIIAAQKDAEDGYVPLDPAELARARALLD